MKSDKKGISRLIAATENSMAGLASTFRTEEAFRMECVLALVLLPVAFWIGDSPLEVAILIASVLLLLMTEILNTAVELTIDRIGDDYNELSGRAKDAGSAAVFVALVLMIVVWIGVLAT